MYDLLQVMQQDGYLSSGELIALRKTCKELGENPVRILRSLNIASPEQIQEYLQRYFRVNALGDQAISLLDESYQSYIPIDLAIHYSCFGLGEENSALYVALEDPSDIGVIQQLRFFLNKRIIGISATVFQLAEGLSKIYRVSIPNLRLTTVIEKSRGVIGGLRYEAAYETEAISIGDDFAGANLSDDESDEVNTFVANTPEAAMAIPKNNAHDDGSAEPSPDISFPEMNKLDETSDPSVGFIDGSSGEIAKGVLDIEEKADSEGVGLEMAPPSEVKTEEEEPKEASATESSEPVVQEEVKNDENLLSEETTAVSDPPLEEAPVQAQASVAEEELISEEDSGEIIEEATSELSEEVSLEAGSSESQPAEEQELISEESEIKEESLSIDEELLSDEAPVENNQPQNSPVEMNENQIAQLSALASSALIKVSMITDKNQAIDLVNTLLNSFHISVTFEEGDTYKITGEDFTASGSLSSQLNQNDNPISYAIDPVLKRILKMNNSA